MSTPFKRNLLAALITGILLPVAAQAAEAYLLKRITTPSTYFGIIKATQPKIRI